jgi:integrase/recombinase XerD
MELEEAIKKFLKHRKLKDIEAESLGLYQRIFRQWLAWRGKHKLSQRLDEVSLDELQDFLAYLHDEHIPYENNTHRTPAKTPGLAPATIDVYYRLLRAFWRWCDSYEFLTSQQARFFMRDRIPRPKLEQKIRRHYDETEIEKLLDACQDDEPEQTYRDRAIIYMLLESGMRASELCSLTDEDVELKNRRARLRGKGGKYRWVYWHIETAVALMHYLKHRRGGKGGPLFRGIGSTNDGERLSRDGLRSILRRLAKRAGITLPEGAPVHAFRHTFAHRALDAGRDISEVSQLLGHSNVATTMRYLREYPNRLQDIHRRIFEANNPDKA